jgi:hypothetical protein
MWRRVGIVLTDVSEEQTVSLLAPAHAISLADFFFFFYHEDGGDTFLRNVG